MIKYHSSDKIKLNYKRLSIVITNVCNLSCGGCHQLCGHFSKDQLWYISLENFEKAVNACAKWADEYWGLADFPDYDKNIGIYGGEPLMHPLWDDICLIMKKYNSYKFLIYTNGLKFDKKNSKICLNYFKSIPHICSRQAQLWSGQNETEVGNKIKKLHNITCCCTNNDLNFCGLGNLFEVGQDMGNDQTGNLFYYCTKCKTYIEVKITPPEAYRTNVDQNIQYLVCEKNKESLRAFIPSLVAPIDFEEQEKTKEQYWLQAKKKCYIWNKCESAIYNDKAYFCVAAAAMDNMFNDGRYGWDIELNKNPMNRTDDQIKDQAINFCYRCGFCFGDRHAIDQIVGQKQLTCNKTFCSDTNFVDITELKKIEKI